MSAAGAATAALLTDYGPGSEHVGALHAVLARGAPEAPRIDLAHDIPPGDVRRGALVLARLVPLLPPGAVVVAVVDPGVGGPRRGLAVRTGAGAALVGPDNGLLAPAADALGGAAAVTALGVPARAAATFHGRDVFAPAAVDLLRGRAPAGAPSRPAGLAWPDLPPPAVAPGRLEALVLGADRFGNLELLAAAGRLGEAGMAPGAAVAVGRPGGPFAAATVARVFADVPPGALLVHADSSGHVAVAANGASAAALLGVGAGERLEVTARGA